MARAVVNDDRYSAHSVAYEHIARTRFRFHYTMHLFPPTSTFRTIASNVLQLLRHTTSKDYCTPLVFGPRNFVLPRTILNGARSGTSGPRPELAEGLFCPRQWVSGVP